MEDLEREMLLIAQGNELAFNSFMNRYMDGLYYHSYQGKRIKLFTF